MHIRLFFGLMICFSKKFAPISESDEPVWKTFYLCNNQPKARKMEQIISYLNALKENNNREWFELNKSWYLDAKNQFELLASDLMKTLADFDAELGRLSVKDCTFRIYRDVRFSPNKEPFKTNMGAYFSRGGKNSRNAGYYLHLEPGASFVGGGKWMPEADLLKLIRQEIYHFPEDFISVITKPDFRKKFGGLTGEKLKKPPRDFPSDFEHIELLKHKSYTVVTDLQTETLSREKLIATVSEAFRAIHPLVQFLNRALEERK